MVVSIARIKSLKKGSSWVKCVTFWRMASSRMLHRVAFEEPTFRRHVAHPSSRWETLIIVTYLTISTLILKLYPPQGSCFVTVLNLVTKRKDFVGRMNVKFYTLRKLIFHYIFLVKIKHPPKNNLINREIQLESKWLWLCYITLRST
jgi:hypothetical protein